MMIERTAISINVPVKLKKSYNVIKTYLMCIKKEIVQTVKQILRPILIPFDLVNPKNTLNK
jgi:antitoxin component of RelBE/YafQ-DinJ toxin-antitoxin module